MTNTGSIGDISQIEAHLGELRESGEHQFYPARFGYIEALVRRAASHNQGVAKNVLERAHAALKEYRADCANAQVAAGDVLLAAKKQYPDSLPELQQLFERFNFAQMNRKFQSLEGRGVAESLADLAAYVSQPSLAVNEVAREPSFDDILRQQEHTLVNGATNAERPQGHSVGQVAGKPHEGELNSMHYLRESLVKRNADKLVTQLIRDVPEGAGPLNPQKLIV